MPKKKECKYQDIFDKVKQLNIPIDPKVKTDVDECIKEVFYRIMYICQMEDVYYADPCCYAAEHTEIIKDIAEHFGLITKKNKTLFLARTFSIIQVWMSLTGNYMSIDSRLPGIFWWMRDNGYLVWSKQHQQGESSK